MIEAMYVAAGLGQIIANRAYLAGASGGCQAEMVLDRDGGRSNLLHQRWRSDRTCLCDGIEEPDGTCM